ncbi:MAG TPA: glycosyltransferase family 4 protein [Ferruginibacter sp.]|nr:glycosyltransferase family 4 protein [Ferruginibacter sp.]
MNSEKIKVGIAGRWNPRDKNAWSGIYYSTCAEIEKYFDTEFFFYKWPWHVRERLILHKQFQKLIRKKAAVEFLRGYGKYFSKQLEKELRGKKIDLLFVPSAPQLVAYADIGVPMVYLTDATFFQLQGYYPLFSDIARYNIEQGVAMDRLAFEKATHVILASDWAKRSAVLDYGIPETKISVVPFGANLDRIPTETEIKKDKNEVCRLLFLGVEWERKGGQIALDTFYQLKRNGFPVQFTIIGCVPPVPVTDPDIEVIPFINRHNNEEAGRLYQIFRQTDFLLLPTRAECAGIVFCEASAFGVPSITTDTGGVSTNVINGVNGFALAPEAGAEAYAQKIRECFSDDAVYRQLSKSSRRKFEEDLNWEHWGKQFQQIAQRIITK